jgi:hypothetical protein
MIGGKHKVVNDIYSSWVEMANNLTKYKMGCAGLFTIQVLMIVYKLALSINFLINLAVFVGAIYYVSQLLDEDKSLLKPENKDQYTLASLKAVEQKLKQIEKIYKLSKKRFNEISEQLKNYQKLSFEDIQDMKEYQDQMIGIAKMFYDNLLVEYALDDMEQEINRKTLGLQR